MIEITDLWRSFGSVEVLRGMSLQVPEGSAFALVGTNGAGKTTTLKIVMNLLRPSAGSVRVLGVDSHELAPRDLTQIGYVADGQKLPARLTAGQYLDYLRPFYPAWDRGLERSLVAELGVPSQRLIGHLSHGTRVKLALVAALSFRPRLLVLDEPLGGLDPLVRDELMGGLLHQAEGMTIFISSHELAEIESMVTHVGLLDEGRLLVQEPTSELAERLRAVRVVFDHEAMLPATVPEEWLQLQAMGNVLSFVDTRYSEEATRSRIAAVLGATRAVDVQPMSLRAMFTTLARATRGALLKRG
jgi:ABC-2 type transport system ATP-binding protein